MDIDMNQLNLFMAVMNYGKGSQMLKYAKKTEAIAPTLFMGDGTVRNELLNKFGLLEMKKEIFIALVDSNVEKDFYQKMKENYHMEKPNHGISFSVSVKSLSKIKDKKKLKETRDRSRKDLDYEAIFAIVDKGLSREVVDAAQEAGSRGGTIVHGRGAGSTKKAKLFNLEIEPEKDIVLILSKSDQSETIIDSIKKDLKMSDPGKGIIFVLDVNQTMGLYQDEISG